jgi:hypothetical protein
LEGVSHRGTSYRGLVTMVIISKEPQNKMTFTSRK